MPLAAQRSGPVRTERDGWALVPQAESEGRRRSLEQRRGEYREAQWGLFSKWET